MNTVPRPAQVTPRMDHYAELGWSRLLGAGLETIGPYRTSRDLERAISAARAPYPGDHGPSVRRRWTVELPPAPARVYAHLAAQGQDPRVEPMQDGCHVLSFAHRERPGRGRVYCAPGGSWTHSPGRAAQLARRFPLELEHRRAVADIGRNLATSYNARAGLEHQPGDDHYGLS